MTPIAVVDYRAGNLPSVLKALEAAGAEPARVNDPSGLATAAAIVVPGVGHFKATRVLDGPWRRQLLGAMAAGVPVLGICLGMQWLFDGSEESTDDDGLGIFPGRCFALEGPVKVPHVGWNRIERAARTSVLLDGLGREPMTYFTHSFAAPATEDAAGVTVHGRRFAAVVERGRTFGVQFHPEKSGAVGLRLLANFVAFVRAAR